MTWPGPSGTGGSCWPALATRLNVHSRISSGSTTCLRPEHSAFYASQRFTLNVTRAQMREAGFSPSVRLFEAAACGVPIISDRWEGLDAVLRPGEEILVADGTDDVREMLALDEETRLAIAGRARERVLAEHTAAQRVDVLEHEARSLRDREPAS